jgi:small subunit ribosomal protein S8
MSISDPIADMLTRVRNGQQARLKYVMAPASKILTNILEVLQKEGYIRSYSVLEVRKNISEIKIELKYINGSPAIQVIKRNSKPGRRQYSKIVDLAKFYNGLGISILSTPKGVMTDYDARKLNVGGEILCSVF